MSDVRQGAISMRTAIVYPPYDTLQFTVPGLAEGDVNSRVWICIREIAKSFDVGAMADIFTGRASVCAGRR